MIQKPKGTMDLYGDDSKKWLYITSLIGEIMEKYNYNYIKVPTFERSELFHRSVGIQLIL
jgi:histidyl-tRNA synthetase